MPGVPQQEAEALNRTPPLIQCELCGLAVRVGQQTFQYYILRLRGRWRCFSCDPLNNWD